MDHPWTVFKKIPCVCVFLPSSWSNASYWENSAENNFTAPTDGANVVIPSGNVWENKLVSVMDFFVFKKVAHLLDSV